MASYNELNALIDAYINRNGVQAITGQILNGVLKAMVEQLGRGYTIMGAAIPATDPGTPDGPECYFASETGTYTDFDGLQVVPGELALLCYTPSDGWTKATIYEGFRQVGATIDGNVGTPSVGVSYANGVLSFDFRNLKGSTGDPAGFGTVAATVDENIGTPGVSVQTSGPDTAKNLTFAFTNLKGETGVTSVVATVDNTSGNPSCAVSLQGQQLTLAFTGLKGAQGDTGSSVDYPFTIVNNLTTDDATQALSAAQGVVLDGKVTQLEAKVNDLSTGKYYGYFAQEEDLPEADVDGFAYVGEGPTYTIYNLRGGVWTSSDITVNQSPIGNDEDIDQNEDGKLQFANRVYNAQQPNGMGYKILRKDATFASQVTDENTIYEIRYDFDLGDAEGDSPITIPPGCTLLFNGGKVVNGSIVFQNTIVKSPKFANCYYSGTIITDYLDDRDWTSLDDFGTMRFLLKNTIVGGIRADFYRDYVVELDGVIGNEPNANAGFVRVENLTSGCFIDFHGNSITNNTVFPGATGRRQYIFLVNVNDVTIQNVNVIDTAHDNTQLANSKGVVFVYAGGDCDNINLINIYQEGGDNVFRSGAWNTNWPVPTKGVTNSRFIVSSKNIGYGITIECGSHIKAIVRTINPHRGMCLSALEDADIVYFGHNAHAAKCHCLISDSLYYRVEDDGTKTPDLKGCKNMRVVCNIEESLASEKVFDLATYGDGSDSGIDYSFRSGRCKHENISLISNVGSYSGTSGNTRVLVGLSSMGGNLGNDIKNITFRNLIPLPILEDGTIALLQTTGIIEGEINFIGVKTVTEPTVSHNSNVLRLYGTFKGNINAKDCNLGAIQTDSTIGKEDVIIELDNCSRQEIGNVTLKESHPKSFTSREVSKYFGISGRVYNIDKDIDQHSSGLTLPADSTLFFNGGRFLNISNITGNNTKIIGYPNIPNENLVGTWHGFGDLNNAPRKALYGHRYFAKDKGIPVFFNNYRYVDGNGFCPWLAKSGTTAQRPVFLVDEYAISASNFSRVLGRSIFIGFTLKNNTDGKYYVATAISGDTVTWTEQDTVAGKTISDSVARRGATFPDGADIYVGFCFYHTSRNQWYEATSIVDGDVTWLPVISTARVVDNIHFSYYDTDLGKMIYVKNRKDYYGLADWEDAEGMPAEKTKGTTAERPSASTAGAGFTYFDTDLGKMIVSNGTSWVNMDGTALS